MQFKNIILDATNYACQALLSKRRHYNSHGHDISLVMNFVNKIGELEDKFGPERIIFCWEGGKCLSRLAVYADYKATRPSPAGEGSESFRLTFSPLVTEMGYENFSIDNYEGDDAIAAKAREFTAAGESCLVVSPDKDMLQLVSQDDMVKCYLPHKNKVIDSSNFQEYTGLPLGAFGDYLILVGDASDNIPGVAGVADVTAKWLLNEFGSIENAIAMAADIRLMASAKGKAGANARRSLEMFTPGGSAAIERNRKLVIL